MMVFGAPPLSLVLITFILAISPTLLVSSHNNFSIAKPNCDDRCGDISIPFPFGTTQECYQSRPFMVRCNHSFEPPRLLWGNESSIQFTNISLDGQAKILRPVARDCYAPDGTRDFQDGLWIRLATFFTVNNTANKFTMVGCNTEASAFGVRLNGKDFKTGCTAMCEDREDLLEGSCTGLGCCQTSIPKMVRKIDVELKTNWSNSDAKNFTDCSYAFVVEESEFRFSQQNLTNLKNVTGLPMVVDWVINNVMCKEAERNSTSFACKSVNSICYEPVNGDGYRCRCNDGYQGNPYLVNGCIDINECEIPSLNTCKHSCDNTVGNFTCPCPSGYRGDGRKDGEGCSRDESLILRLVAGIALGIIVLLLSAILLHLELKRRSSEKTKHKFFLQNGGVLLQEKLMRRERSADIGKVFTSSELQKATNEFDDSMIIGQGGFGTVYKGLLPNNKIVAIKKSKKVDLTQIEQFINEVFVLSQVNHRNVVRLLGCCLETEVPLLVYEFISNGTLSQHVHNQVKSRFLNWDIRLKIAAETAGVLSYLHSAASTPIIHRDVKSDNILLDYNFTAKVSDFGASKLVPLDLTQLSTMVQGTFGYLDPEYMQTNQLTEKSDVYSFGVVLLELLTGRRAISFDKPEKEKILANYFLSVLKQERLFEILDENIVGHKNMEQISEVAKLAKACLHVKGEDRPSMKEVAMELEGLILGGKHSWARNVDSGEEMVLLLGEDMMNGVKGMITIGGSSSTSVGFDSIIRDHVLSPVSGGR